MINQLTEDFKKALLSLDRVTAKNILTDAAHSQGPIECVEKIVVPVMEQMGAGWEEGKVALSQVYMSGRICEEMVDTILPPLDSARKAQPNMAIVVFNDYHFLGKRLVYTTLRASGFELKDYGRVDDIETIMTRIQNDSIEILLISVLMLNSALRIKNLIESLKEANINIKVIVGGAPFRFDKQLFKEVGADAMGTNASEAVDVVTKVMEELR